MDIKGDGGREKGCRVQIKIQLRQVCKRWRKRWRLGGRRLRNFNVFDGLAVTRLMTDIGYDETSTRESPHDSKSRKEPARLSQEIVEDHGMRDAVRTGPRSHRCSP